MTTSILSHKSNELTGFDIQVLKDFAVDAPWEWRMALEALIEVHEDFQEDIRDFEGTEEAIEELRENCKDAIKEIRTEVKAFLDKKLRTNADVAYMHKMVDDALQTLDEASDVPPQPVAPSVPPPPPEPIKGAIFKNESNPACRDCGWHEISHPTSACSEFKP